jgi:hypothetical protein
MALQRTVVGRDLLPRSVLVVITRMDFLELDTPQREIVMLDILVIEFTRINLAVRPGETAMV